MITVLSLLFLLSAVISIYVKENGKLNYYFLTKPITTSLVILISAIIYFQTESIYSLIILVSLLLSLLGDILLLREDRFVKGLTAFLFAHIGFTTAFISLGGFDFSLPSLFVLIVLGILYFIWLKRDLKEYKIPVFLYFMVILIMSWQAINLYLKDQSLVFFGIASASLLFALSDAIIAFQKFKRSFKGAEVLILSTYWLSIYLFAIVGSYI